MTFLSYSGKGFALFLNNAYEILIQVTALTSVLMWSTKS